MVITRQHQNMFINGDIAAKFIQQFFHLVLRQYHDIFLVAFGQTVQRLLQLIRVLLHKLIGNFTDAVIEPVSRIQCALRSFAKIVSKRRGQGQLRTDETVNRLPVVPHSKQTGMFVKFTQGRKQQCTLGGNVLEFIHQNMLPRADKTPFFQNIDCLMDKPGKVHCALFFQCRFPGFHQRCHQTNTLCKQIFDVFRRAFDHLRLTATVHTHQAEPAFKAASEALRQRFIFPVITLRNGPFQFVCHPLPPAAGLHFFLCTLLLPCLNQ
ncbi:hypothetical protein SRABI106_04859 [Rahnella aquatilis]|nr:hypothetical protein SRABI106_04859 [Rahnella aquatilis]